MCALFLALACCCCGFAWGVTACLAAYVGVPEHAASVATGAAQGAAGVAQRAALARLRQYRLSRED